MSTDGHIVQISVSPGGRPKRPITHARMGALGLEGDAHRSLAFHGGPERALCLLSMERIRTLQAEGHPITPGAIGENVTVEGLDWSRVVPGRRLLLGEEVRVEVTGFTSPCRNIAISFIQGDCRRVSQKAYPGDSRVYARVLRVGAITQGDPVRLLTAPASPLQSQ